MTGPGPGPYNAPMDWIADLHIHSHYSRATSKQLDILGLAHWAERKGVDLVGTADLTHPGWLAEIKQHLIPDEEGLFRMADPPRGAGDRTRFVLTGEISCIYKQGGRVRKVHLVPVFPTIEAVEKFNARLAGLGCNLTSDGRPIVGLTAKQILELTLSADEAAELIPAHIWTPWFSVLGSKSGFESIEECFEDLSGHIHAVETGLSSDPPMNWRVSSLDKFRLVSSSDAHSPAKLGREATLFSGPLSYANLLDSLRHGTNLKGTLEFFPEEGKYHLDGHRKCDVRLEPEETNRLKGICPVCGKPLTVGVLNRVEVLADQPVGRRPDGAGDFESLLSLDSVLSQVLGKGPATKTVTAEYDRLTGALGSELFILRRAPIEEIGKVSGPVAAEAVGRVRRGQVTALGGYDGVFGQLTIFTPEERAELSKQSRLFAAPRTGGRKKRSAPAAPKAAEKKPTEPEPDPAGGRKQSYEPDPDQQAAVDAPAGPTAIIAGPGSGKTGTLVRRAARLAQGGGKTLALTFTRKAAEELAERLTDLVGPDVVVSATFHGLGLSLLRDWGLDQPLIEEDDRDKLITRLAKAQGLRPKLAGQIIDQTRFDPQAGKHGLTDLYREQLRLRGLWDFDDLICLPLELARTDPAKAADLAGRFDHILIDEFQDLNPIQYAWLDLLAPDPAASLTVVGDPDQSIYGFRGASPKFFDRLLAARPGATVVRLDRSYRLPGRLVEAAGAVLSANRDRSRPLKAVGSRGRRLGLAVRPSPAAEAVFISRQIEALMGGLSHRTVDQDQGLIQSIGAERIGLGDIAVLFRLHAQGKEIATALDRSGLPYQSAGQEPGREVDRLDFTTDRISLLTFHAAKGLEFPLVFIAGVEDGLVPYARPDEAVDWDEERRLFYVALTRAQERVILSRSLSRTMFGKSLSGKPSALLDSIPADLVRSIDEKERRSRQVQLDLF